MAGHEKGDGAYVLSRQPDIILFMQARFTPGPLTESEVGRVAWGVSKREMLGSAALRLNYVWQSAQLPGFVFNYYRRREGAHVATAPGAPR